MVVTIRPDIAALAPYRQGRSAAPDAFKLSSNESPFPPHPAVLAAIAESQLNRYPDGTAAALRERLAARHGVTVDEIHVGAGSVAILHQLAQATAGPGDEIVHAWRSFEAYPGIVTISGATGIHVPLLPDGRHDMRALAAAVTDRSRLVLVCSPNNPTGTAVSKAEFADFMAAVPDTVLVILDEAYREFVDDPDAVDGIPLLERYPNLVVLRTFSKAFGLAGLRIGYAVGPAYVLDAARSAAIALSVIEPAQRAALAALDHEQELLAGVDEIRHRRDEVAEALRDQGWSIPRSQGNFLWLPTGDRTTEAADVLESHGVVARVFAGEGIRVSIGEAESVPYLLRGAAEVVATLRESLSDARIG